MFDIIIQNSASDVFKSFLDLGSALIGYATGGIALYVAYLRFWSKNLKAISYSPNFRSFYGDIVSIIIENCTLSNFSILGINLVYNNQYIMRLVKYDEPLLVEPFKTIKIESEPITLAYPSLFDLDNFKDLFARIETSKGVVYSKIRGKIKNKNYKTYEIASVHRESIAGTIVANSIKYILFYKGKDEEIITVFIDKVGTMSSEITNFNAIPKEAMKNKDALKCFFKKVLNPLEIPFSIEERTILNEV